MPNSTIEISKIKQLQNQLYSIEDDEQKLQALQELAEFYTYTNIREAQKLLAEQYKLFQKYHHPDMMLNFHLNTAIVENQFYNFKLSDIHFNQALNIVEEEGNVTQITEVYIDYAGTLINLGKREKALDYIDKAHRYLSKFPNDILYARLMCREGYLLWQFSDYDRATELFFQADKILANSDPKLLKIKDLYFQTLIHAGLGLVYEKTNDLERCVSSYLRVVDMCEQAGIRSRLAWHYLNVGKAYMAMDDFDNAERFFTEVNRISDDISQSARASATANLGFSHYLSGRYEEALEMYNRAEQIYKRKPDDYDNLSTVARWKGLLYDAYNKPKRAENKLGEALEYAKLAKNPRQQAIVCRDIAELYAERQDFRTAYEYEVLHNQFVKKYYEELNSIKINELEFKYEAERRKKEAEMLRLQASSLQMKALRAQMNPHFMYNALNSIQNSITSNDASFAEKYLAKFAKLMRESLEYSELEIISLEDELEFLEDYLIINQKLRFEDRMQYKITVDEELEDDIIGVPTMIVQPYIENAIEHGIRPKKGGLIKIEFHLLDEKTIMCTIEDNGIGRDKAREMQLRDGYHLNHKSRGTNITEKRLELLHSGREDKFSVKVHDLKDPLSNEALGTRVEILIPIVELPYERDEF